jgi:hypothetical protein
MREISEEEFKELLSLYVIGYRSLDRSGQFAAKARRDLNDRLKEAAGNIPFPYSFNDYRRAIVERFLDRLKKEDPRFKSS